MFLPGPAQTQGSRLPHVHYTRRMAMHGMMYKLAAVGRDCYNEMIILPALAGRCSCTVLNKGEVYEIYLSGCRS